MGTFIQELKKIGLRCKKSKFKFDAFTIELDPKRTGFIVNIPKDASIKIHPNKTKKQAVINVTEEERTSYFKESIWITYDSNNFNSEVEGKDIDSLMKHIRTFSSVLNEEDIKSSLIDASHFVQDGVYTITSWKTETRSDSFEVEFTVSAPKQTNSFLIGKDESHCFISQLPEICTSVTKAHKVLRPDVSDKAIRVGEWFFDPVTDDSLCNTLWEHFSADVEWEYNNEYSDNHQASIIAYYGSEVYVTGTIYDTRQTHKDVLLKGFHKVVRNNEVVNEDGDRWD